MLEKTITSNGHEIEHPVDKLTAEEFKQHMSAEFGFDGSTPKERIERLKDMSVEGVAILIEDINKSVQGSRDSLMAHDEVISIGGQETLPVESRHQVFVDLIETIRNCPDEINPTRIGDVLALGVVLLHPFHDGNGRTARVLGLMFREEYDGDEYEEDYDAVTEPRDVARARGGFVIYGYTPRLREGADQSSPEEVSRYLRGILSTDDEQTYIGPFGHAPLK